MGNNEEGKSSKSEKSSSPAPPDQTNIHVYPDWAAMQAYYGPRVALPPYYNSAVASGHAPHPYMWGPPQPMMPPYGAPYAAVYSHGGVYAHPAVPIGSHPPGPGVPSSPAPAVPANAETPLRSSENSDRGLIKKLKGFDGLAMSIGNGNGSTESGDQRLSQSVETEGSSDGSDGSSTGGRKRSCEDTPAIGKAVGASAGMTTALELRNLPAKTSPTATPQPCAVLPPSEAWLQNEREIKRERRKQSNRESARRSRLRKQAETEELAHRVETLTAENVGLKSDIRELTEKSEKLRSENAALVGKLKGSPQGNTQEVSSKGKDVPNGPSTENLLSRVNNSASVDRNNGDEGELYERNSNSGTKLHQLLDTSPRADAVAAG